MPYSSLQKLQLSLPPLASSLTNQGQLPQVELTPAGKTIVAAGTQFALRPTNDVQSRFREQNLLIEGRRHIDCTLPFVL